MRLLVFQGADAAEAMGAVRRALGSDALILETRAVDGGIEVLAASDRDASAPKQNRRAPPALTPLPAPRGSARDRRRDELEWHGVRGMLRDRLLDADPIDALAGTLGFGALPLGSGMPPLLFAGQPGAGKTLTVIKLATRLVLAGRSPLVISADGRKAGAVEQMATLTRLLGLTLVVADQPDHLARALARRRDGVPVLIDGPGLLTEDAADRALLRTMAEAAAAEIVLVQPGGLDPDEATEIACAHAELGARSMVATRLDVTRRIGALLAAGFGSGLALAEYADGADPARDLRPLTPDYLADRLAHGPSPAADRSPHPDPDSDGECRATIAQRDAA